MPNLAKIQTAQINIEDVIRSSHLNNELKEKFLLILPNIDKDQIKEIYDFIQAEEKKISDLEQKIKKEESEFYQKMLKEVEQDLEKEKKEIRKISEKNENKKDEEIEDELLDELEKI